MTEQAENYEALCEAGRLASQNMTEGRFIIGDLAILVGKHYGRNTIASFAKDINIEVGRVREYRTVSKFFEISARTELLSTYPTLSYSHFRTAMRLKTIEAATAFLEECGTNAYTVEQAGVKVLERVGKPTPPKKIFDAECRLTRIFTGNDNLKNITFEVIPGADLSALSERWGNGMLRVVVYESEEADG